MSRICRTGSFPKEGMPWKRNQGEEVIGRVFNSSISGVNKMGFMQATGDISCSELTYCKNY